MTPSHAAGKTAALKAFLLDRKNEWIDGRHLAVVGGAYGWRTRVSNLRKAPHHLRITNRQQRFRAQDGQVYTLSEYRLEGRA